ncbi:MAG: cell division protein FtsA [Acidobacteriota bacterium]
MAKKNRPIAGIDIGTTKICCVIAEANPDGIDLLGIGVSPSRGLRKGIVVNLTETIASVKASLALAESQAQAEVESAYVSIGGTHLRGVNSQGQTEVQSRGHEITGEDVDRAIAAAQTLELPDSHEVIHVLTQGFRVDDQIDIVNPLGMCGRELGVHLHLVVNSSAVVQNIVSAVNKSGVVVDAVVMQQLASSQSILSEDEMELGTVLVDIGGGTTDLAVYSHKSICHSAVLAMGGAMITKDIAIGLRTPIQEAEQLKKEAGCAFPESVPSEEVVEISEVGSGCQRSVSRQRLCRIVRARCDEILQAVAKTIHEVGVDQELITGLVLTGGGSLLDGLRDRAEQITEMPVRLGYPVNVVAPESEVFHPAYCTALGLIQYARNQGRLAQFQWGTLRSATPRPATERIKDWILERIG